MTFGTTPFDTNGGGTGFSISLSTNAIIDLTLPDYILTREGYTFTGWYLDANLTQKITSIQPTENTKIYVGWKKRKPVRMLWIQSNFLNVE